MPPNLATYQKAANSIYNPQQASDIAGLQATERSTINTLEASKPQIATDYQSAINTLTQTTQANAAKINQLYSERLGGNFSGLQGNDLGNMYGMAAQQQSIISQTMANKLAQITGQESNAKIAYATGVSQEKSKIQSAKAQYAQSAYGSAQKNYVDAQYKNAQLQMEQERLGLEQARFAQSGSNRANNANNAYLAQFQASPKKGGGFSYKGPNGEAMDLGQYAMTLAQGNSGNALAIIENQLQQSGTKYDKRALADIGNGKKIGASNAQILKALQSGYNIDFNGMM